MYWKHLAILALSILIIFLIFCVGKYLFLRHRTEKLIRMSDKYSRDYYVGNKLDPQVNYIVLGDSTAEGTGSDKVEDSYPYLIAANLASQKEYVHVLNYSVSGAKSKDIPSQIAKINVKPDYISLVVGANDATHFISERDYRASLEKNKALLDKYPQAKIIIANTPQMGDIPALKNGPAYFINSRAKQQNKIFQQVFKNSRYNTVNLYEDARLESDFGNKLYAADLFHPSSEGYLVWSKFFIQAANI